MPGFRSCGLGFRVPPYMRVRKGRNWDTGKENGNYYLGFSVLRFRVQGFRQPSTLSKSASEAI